MKITNHNNYTFKNRKGQALTEYLILTALIAIASISVVQVLSTNLRRKMATVSESIRGEERSFEGVKATESHYKIYDMGDFNKGMIDSDSE